MNLRQTPGAHNMMGRIKFMLPNDLGVYLHDTPLRAPVRRRGPAAELGLRARRGCGAGWSAGCSAAGAPQPSGAPEQRVDLPEPVPVYIAYFTALPSRDGVAFLPDVYGATGLDIHKL